MLRERTIENNGQHKTRLRMKCKFYDWKYFGALKYGFDRHKTQMHKKRIEQK